MICSQISNLLGVSCHPLSDDGNVAMINTSFAFEDGTGVPVFVEKAEGMVRFFDDGEVILHFLGRGVKLDDLRKTRFIKNITEPNGVLLNDLGELEIWAPAAKAPVAFSQYMSALLGLVSWEKSQIGIATDMSLLVSEVGICLHAWKPTAPLIENPEYTGISGHRYKLDFNFNGDAVIAISPHHQAVSYAIKKLIDIRSAPANSELGVLVIIDDRYEAELAKRESLVMDAVANVMLMTKLEKQAGVNSRAT